MKGLLGALFLLVLSACTTIQEGKRKPDLEASARDRVAIAAEYLKKNDSENALLQLRRALKANPDSPEAHLMMGVLLERDGNVKKADKEYRKALRLKSGYSQAHNNYGIFLLKNQRYKDAKVQFQAAADDVSYDFRAQAYEGLGRTLKGLGNMADAEQAFMRALRLDASLPTSTLEVAEVLYERGDQESARKGYQRFLKLTEDRSQTAQSLWLGIRLERDAGRKGDRNALASYELALKKLYPDSPECKLYMASLKQGQ